jgi:uncharacterized protein (DUF58 family)
VKASALPDHLVREVRYIELRTTRRIRRMRLGGYASPVKGDAFEFDQHRPYRPGDDVRRIDWNATARVGTPFLRQTRAERELHMVLVGDLSRSMEFAAGGRSKHEALVLTTATLLFAALADQISSGVIGFTDRVLDWTAPVSDEQAAWAALGRLWAIKPAGNRTLIQPAIQHLLRTVKGTTLVVLISDFQTDEELTAIPELVMLASRHDVLAVVLEDPAEARLPDGPGLVRLRDPESKAEITVGLNTAVRTRFASAVKQRHLELQQSFYRSGVDHVFVNSQGDVVEPLLRVFDRRKS